MKTCASAERKKNRAARIDNVQPGRMSFRSLHVSADASALFWRLSMPAGRQLAGAVETFEEDYLSVVISPVFCVGLPNIQKLPVTMIDPARPCLEYSKPTPVRELLKSIHIASSSPTPGLYTARRFGMSCLGQFPDRTAIAEIPTVYS